jgi:hypothetical protein
MALFKTIGEVDLGEYGHALVRVGRYPQSGQVAISLIDANTSEPIATLSTNLAEYDVPIAPDSAGIKNWGENEAIIKPLLASGLFKDSGQRVKAGLVTIPVWQLANPDHVPPAPPQPRRSR